VPISWNGVVKGLWLNFAPFTLAILVEILFDAVIEGTRASNTTIYVYCILILAVNYIVA
jgi:hypothetical protein